MTKTKSNARRAKETRSVSADVPLLIAELHRLLDNGFRRCRALAEKMQNEIELQYHDQLELLYIGQNNLKPILRPLVNEFYKVMTRTIFEGLRLLQPEDFKGGKKVNFYFLPGYHSHLINKRIFYQEEANGPSGSSYKSFGLGLTGGAKGEPEEYHDCRHARWYHYATTPPRPRKDFLPASPYHWFAYQQPRIEEADPHNLVASLTFSMDASAAEDKNFPEHKVLNLAETGESSLEWGTQVAEMLNEMQYVSHPDWKFPDRGDRKQASDPHYDENDELRLRRIRCLLISLWMHSVFESKPPDWWDELNEELGKQQLESMSEAIGEALNDEIASNWADQRHGPGFRTWTMINLHPLIAPPPTPLFGPKDHAARLEEASAVYRQTIGWATMFCSCSLGIPFISAVRQWIRTVYSMLRSAEVTVLLKNREPHVRAAQMVRLFSHDSYRFMEESVGTVLRQAEDCSPKAVAYRKHVIQALRVLNTFTFTVSNALPHQEKLAEQRSEFLKALNVGEKRLVDCLYSAANDIQRYRRRRSGTPAIVTFPKHPTSKREASSVTHMYCLLLVGELIRNYCRYGPAGYKAELSANIIGGELCIELTARAETRPAGEDFAILDNLLGTLGIGDAKIEDHGNQIFRWRVTVRLKEPEST